MFGCRRASPPLALNNEGFAEKQLDSPRSEQRSDQSRPISDLPYLKAQRVVLLHPAVSLPALSHHALTLRFLTLRFRTLRFLTLRFLTLRFFLLYFTLLFLTLLFTLVKIPRTAVYSVLRNQF